MAHFTRQTSCQNTWNHRTTSRLVCTFPFLSSTRWFICSFPNTQVSEVTYLYLRNRKHVTCLYRVIETRVEVWENEKCCGNTSPRRVFPQFLRVLPNFHECFYNSIVTQRTCSISFRKHRDEKNENNLLTLTIKTPSARASSVFLSSYRNTIFNQSACIFS